jgi:hypothetical protein
LKQVQERAGNGLEEIGIGKDFPSRIQVAQKLRERTDKCDYIKSKSFCTTKEMISELKRPPTEWKKTFSSYTSDTGLIARIYRELKKLNSPEINDPIKKWATELNGTFSKEEVWLKKKKNYMKKMLTMPGQKGNANQNHTNISPHSC